MELRSILITRVRLENKIRLNWMNKKTGTVVKCLFFYLYYIPETLLSVLYGIVYREVSKDLGILFKGYI